MLQPYPLMNHTYALSTPTPYPHLRLIHTYALFTPTALSADEQHTPTAVSHGVQDGANSVLALDMEESEVVVQDNW